MIFISYRTTDTNADAGRLRDSLVNRFGEEAVFRDAETLRVGDSLNDDMLGHIARARLLILVIGPNWRVADLHNTSDWVRREMETALQHGVCLAPVLVGGGVMPRESELPESLRRFSSTVAQRLDHHLWEETCGKVAELYSRLIGSERRDFFSRLARVGLDQSLTIRPDHVLPEDLRSFCMPVHVVRERAFRVMEERRRERAWQGEELDYLFATHETFHFDELNRIPIEPLEHALESARDIMLRGEPGEGKSTALWLYAAARYEKLAQGTDVKVPFIVRLGDVPARSDVDVTLTDIAVDTTIRLAGLTGRQADARRAWLGEHFTTGRAELLLDAFDELTPAREDWLRENIAVVRSTGTRVIVTSRPTADELDLNLVSPERLRLVCFGPRQSAEYTRRYLAEKPEGRANLLKALDNSPGVRALAQIPLLLAILCETQSGDEEMSVPSTRGELLRIAMQQMMRRGARRRGEKHDPVREVQYLAALARLAWRFLGPRPLVFDEMEGAEALGEMWRVLRSDGILTSRGGNRFGFVLRSFHEYAASRELARRLDAGEDAFRGFEFKPEVAPGWREIWPLAVGCSSDPNARLQELDTFRVRNEDTASSRALLLAHAAGEVSEHAFTSETRERLGSCVDYLLQRLFTGELSEEDRGSIARALAMMPPSIHAVRSLIQVAKDVNRENSLRMLAIEALGFVGGEQARDALLEMSEIQHSEDLRGQSVTALARVGGAAAAERVAELWRSTTPHRVRMATMVTLADLGDEKSLRLLLDLISDEGADSELRAFALHETATRGILVSTEWAREVLRKHAEAPHTVDKRALKLVECCADVVGQLHDSESVPVLSSIAQSETIDDVVTESIESLGEIGSKQACEALHEIVQAFDGTPRSLQALLALARLGDAAVLPALEQCRSNPRISDSLRATIITATGGIDTLAAETALLDELEQNVSVETSEAVLRVFERRRGSSSWVQIRIQRASRLLDSDHPGRLRLRAAQYLSQQRGLRVELMERVRDTLCASIQSSAIGNHLRGQALLTLGQFDDAVARRVIETTIASQDSWLRRFALQAANRLCRVRGWRLLVRGGWDAPL